MHPFYRILEHVSDAYIEVNGQSLEECFSKAGLALVDLMVDLGTISETANFVFKTEGKDLFSLLYNFMEFILIKVTSEEFLPRSLKTEIRKVKDDYRLRCTGSGENLSLRKHKTKLEVKAMTYHLMEIKEAPGHFVVRFLLDL
jgi:SHS2 domain-containing protein